ncbi:MAG: hypothetical protein JWQ09_3205 [Segetibacter sp.]|nr:hypothetical protein [Segetibacter sp.]
MIIADFFIVIKKRKSIVIAIIPVAVRVLDNSSFAHPVCR